MDETPVLLSHCKQLVLDYEVERDIGEDRQTIDIRLIGIPKVHKVEKVLRKVLMSEERVAQFAVQ